MRPTVLVLSPVMTSIATVLEERYDCVPWPHDEAARDALIAERGEAIEAAVTSGHTGMPTALARRLPRMKLVAINGVGYDQVDTEEMRGLGIRVTNTPDVLTADVADTAIGLMINAMRQLPAAERHVRQGHWPKGASPLARTASGKRYGILGLGRIGLAIAERLAGFGGTIGYTSQTRKSAPYQFFPDVRSLAEASDVLFVANAATAATRKMVDRTVFDALGPEGVLVNVARGAIVDEDALVEALVEKRILAAGLDVFANEPHVPDALFALENVALAPHVGSATHETRAAMGHLMLDNMEAYFAGKPLPSAVV